MSHRDQFFGGVTYAQHGDDLMILNIFWLLGVKHPSYLDIGAHHPMNISNTALLYERGSRGVNVEANPNLIEAFKQQRPLDINLNLGVGVERTVLPFYMFDDFSGRNTFSKVEAEKFSNDYPQFQIREVKDLPVVTINDVVQKWCKNQWLDLLTIDCEGLDYDILASADLVSDNKPKVICVESRCGESNSVKTLMLDKGYVLYCRMVSNLIFVDSRYMDRLYS